MLTIVALSNNGRTALIRVGGRIVEVGVPEGVDPYAATQDQLRRAVARRMELTEDQIQRVEDAIDTLQRLTELSAAKDIVAPTNAQVVAAVKLLIDCNIALFDLRRFDLYEEPPLFTVDLDAPLG